MYWTMIGSRTVDALAAGDDRLVGRLGHRQLGLERPRREEPDDFSDA